MAVNKLLQTYYKYNGINSITKMYKQSPGITTHTPQAKSHLGREHTKQKDGQQYHAVLKGGLE